MVSNRRRRHPRRRRLPAAHRPHQRAHQPGRREDRAARDRRGAGGAPGCEGGGRLRRAAPDLGRGGCSRGGAQRARHREGIACLLPPAAGRLQGAQAPLHRRFDSANADRQGPAPVRRRPVLARMRICVLGAGAIGGFLGARLARAGVDVVLIARGPHLQAMKESGLRVIDAHGDWTVPVEATDDFAAMGDADAVFVTLKAHSLPPVAAGMAANLRAGTAVVSAQNGIPWWYFQRHGGELEGIHLDTVDPGGEVARVIDPMRVIGCIVYPATSLVSPGVVRHVEGERFSLGELDGQVTARSVELSRTLASAGLKAPVQARIRAEVWMKLLGNAVFNPLSALTRASLSEIDAVARGAGIEISVSIDQRIKGAARVGDHKTSMLQDLEAGRPMEIDALTGSVVELGDRLGVPVPHLRTLYSSVKLLQASSVR